MARDAKPPSGSELMKAMLTDERFDDPGWIFERKLDGIRCLAIRDGEKTRLLSRNDLPLDGRYPEVAESIAANANTSFAIDGEAVAFDGAQTSFAKLAQRGARPARVFLYVFDVLWLDGEDVRARPLHERKKLLRDALDFEDPIRLTQYRRERGEDMYAQACTKGWEGIIAKRFDSPYRSKRSRDWQKWKCDMGQELVVGGFTAPKGSRAEFGALLVGHFDPDGNLRYAGKVGTGFNGATLRDIAEKLRPLVRDDPPFADAADIKDRTATWVEPQLVAQIGFMEWTRHGRLRHPRFLGLRDDKAAREVVREA